MIALLRSEFLRFRSRSLVAGVLVGGLLLIAVGLVLGGSLSRKPTTLELTQSRIGLAQCPERLNSIEEGGSGYGVINDYVDYRCLQDFRSQGFAPQSSLALAILPLVLLGSSVIFVAVGIYFGASLVGADWHHRSMTTLLTWESRRWRVYVARMGTVILGTFAIVLFLEAIGGMGLALTAALRGTLFGADGFWLRATVEIAVRVAAVSALAAAFTASIAMMARSTGAALGLLVAYFGYEQLMQAISPTTNFWLLGRSFVVFLAGDDSLTRELGIDLKASVAALAMYAGVALIAAYIAFSHRDVA